MASDVVKKKPLYKRWWVWLIAVIIILGAIGSNSEEGEKEVAENAPTSSESKEDQPKSETQATTAPAETPDAMAGLNEAVSVKSFEVIASKISSAANVGGQYGSTAQGTYLLVNVSVKNVGKEAVMLDTSQFSLKVGDITYDADGGAAIYANEDSSLFLTNINPGNTVNAVVPFDVPADVVSKPDMVLVVSGGMFSSKTAEIKIQ